MSAASEIAIFCHVSQPPMASIIQEIIEFLGTAGKDIFEHPPENIAEAMKLIGAASLIEWIYTHPWWSAAIGVGGVWMIGASQSSNR